jgi:sulfite reductase (NADPH) flavoprotein alpha-component
MIRDPKLKALEELVAGSTPEELIWINGYLAGLLKKGSPEDLRATSAATGKITLVYGTDTGNSKKLATEFATQAKKAGAQVKLQGLDQYRLTDLPREEHFLVIISTHGDGEPPSAARKFYDHIHQNNIRLEKTNFAVLALGDTAYPMFCKVGEEVDQKLEVLGGARLLPLQKCDTDYETDAKQWFESVLNSLTRTSVSVAPSTPAVKKANKKTFIGKILTNLNLSGRGSAKQTHHLEILAEGLSYQPGDSIGIVPHNPVALVDSIARLTGIDESKKVVHRGQEFSVRQLLWKKVNIVYLPERVVKQYASIVGQEIPATRIDLLNLLKIYPVRDSSQFEEVLSILEPIAPRLYSIASSLVAHENEVHVTVARDRFTINDEIGYGLCTDYLVHLPEESMLEFYVHHNSEFKLPDADQDVIMIGPGTGIAPFRSFLEERDATGAIGKNWLFFGDQHFQSDFLYQTEIQNFQSTGVLTQVDLAFSRDQPEKIYVQNKMVARGEELFRWLERGAYLYVCGSREPMSQDVEDALLEIIQEFGGRSKEEASSFLAHMKEKGRYQKDVY